MIVRSIVRTQYYTTNNTDTKWLVQRSISISITNSISINHKKEYGGRNKKNK